MVVLFPCKYCCDPYSKRFSCNSFFVLQALCISKLHRDCLTFFWKKREGTHGISLAFFGEREREKRLHERVENVRLEGD